MQTLIVVQQCFEPCAFGDQLAALVLGQVAELALEGQVELGAVQLPVGHPGLPVDRLDHAIAQRIGHRVGAAHVALDLAVVLHVAPGLGGVVVVVLDRRAGEAEHRGAFHSRTHVGAQLALL